MDDKEGQIQSNKVKVAYEVAEQDFYRFADAWDIDIDIDRMTPEEIDDFNTQKRRITRQIEKGRAAVNDEGNIDYQLFEPLNNLSDLELKRPRGIAWLDTDSAKEGRTVTKLNKLMSSALKIHTPLLAKMDGIDIKFLQAVYSLFLGS